MHPHFYRRQHRRRLIHRQREEKADSLDGWIKKLQQSEGGQATGYGKLSSDGNAKEGQEAATSGRNRFAGQEEGERRGKPCVKSKGRGARIVQMLITQADFSTSRRWTRTT